MFILHTWVMLHTCLRCKVMYSSNNKYINMKLFACVLPPTSILEVTDSGSLKWYYFFALSHMSLIYPPTFFAKPSKPLHTQPSHCLAAHLLAQPYKLSVAVSHMSLYLAIHFLSKPLLTYSTWPSLYLAVHFLTQPHNLSVSPMSLYLAFHRVAQ